MTIKVLITIILLLSGSYGAYLYRNYQETGGFTENTDEYFGYRYFKDNDIEIISCDSVDKEFERPASEKWMVGCRKYLEMHMK